MSQDMFESGNVRSGSEAEQRTEGTESGIKVIDGVNNTRQNIQRAASPSASV